MPSPTRTGQDLLDWLEDRFSDYRQSCAGGYCKEDPKVIADFKAQIADARKALGAAPS